ncbi:hypothetical protein Sango_1746400 [Sesamum angolense]|uniref:Replication protein A OB domain-containing protein n=1 Tax=Sesamum angolense TaxID=2727404 RepID=A0AAE1WM75_9LAMI|nr:hypothetical protein Sango_1746400 [Sesamum angolense]
MHRPLVPVAEVTPNTKNWTNKILVIQKLSPRQSQSSPKKYQRTWSSRVQKVFDIPLFLGSNSLIDVLAVVVDKLEQRSINTKYGMSTIQELVIVNDERKPMILTLWNEVVSTEGAAILAAADKMPIIAATRLHVTDYHGISLSARGFANIIVNPSYSETHSLRTWRANHVFLTELVHEKKYLKLSSSHQNIPRDSFSSVANVITNNIEDKFWVKVTATIMDVDKKYWYMACENCLKGTTGEYGWEITCNFCHTEAIAKPRTKFAITLSDGTTQLDVVIW